MEKEFLRNFMSRLRADDDLFDRFVASARAGANKSFQSTKIEKLTLDDSWIYTIESVLFSVEKIARDPRKFIAEVESIVDVERARKTNAKTIRHLASHSRNVRNIKADGEVVPTKVLTTELEEDVTIYENRFIGALVHRLVSFVEQRRNDLSEHISVLDETGLAVKSDFGYGDSKFAYEMKIVVKEPPEDREYADKIRELIEKIDEVRKRLRILLATPFMRTIDKAKPVHPPIQKTNLLRMQQDYRNCYQLWLYISSYTSLGYSIEVQDKTLPVEGDYFDDLTVLTAMSVQTMLENGLLHKETYDAIPFSDPQVKNYKNLNKFDFETEFKFDKEAANVEDSVNEYYFQQMKQAFSREAKRPRTDDPALQEKELKMSFMRYFNTVARVNNEMYLDLIKKQTPRQVGRTPLQKKEALYAQQSVLVRRLRQLNRLKTLDLDKTVKMEKRELEKLEKQKLAIEKEKERLAKERAKAAKQKEAERLAREKAKAEREAAAQRKEEEAKQKAEARRLAAIEAERQKVLAQKERERLAKEREKAKEKAKLLAQKAREREKAKLAAQKAREREKAKLAAQKQREKQKIAEKQARDEAKALFKANAQPEPREGSEPETEENS